MVDNNNIMINENSNAEEEEREDAHEHHQERGQNRSLQGQQEQASGQHYPEEGMIIHEALQGENNRGDRRREYRRRMTLDPLVDLLVDGTFLYDDDNNMNNVPNNNEVETRSPRNDEGQESGRGEGILMNGAAAAAANNNVDMNVVAVAANNNANESASASDVNGNYSELELLGELLGRYARNGSVDESVSTEGDNGNGNNVDPPQPARNHSYLPTAQPLYPEEWIPAGQHRYRLSRDNSMSDLMLEQFDTEGSDTEANEENAGSSAVSNIETAAYNDNADGLDGEMISPYHYHIPEPPSLLRSHHHSGNTDLDISNEAQGISPSAADTENAIELSTLAIMEMEDVVVFPGSIVPMRIRDRNWVKYLGALIDDARGLYGSHQGSSGGMGEVRIVILPRVGDRARRTRRRPREGGRMGRWQVGLIRRGVASTRRLTRRRRVSNIVETEPNNNSSSRNENEDGSAAQQDVVVMEEESQGPYHSSDEESSEDDLFHPAVAPSPPDDPWVGRIGTMATVTFTHEEIASSTNPEPLVAGAHSQGASASRIPQGYPSSMVWRNRGEELVLTVLGKSEIVIQQREFFASLCRLKYRVFIAM